MHPYAFGNLCKLCVIIVVLDAKSHFLIKPIFKQFLQSKMVSLPSFPTRKAATIFENSIFIFLLLKIRTGGMAVES